MSIDVPPPVFPPSPPVGAEDTSHSLPVATDQQQMTSAGERVPSVTLEEIRPLFASVEQFIREMWHDPRYMARVMIAFMQILQAAESGKQISEIMIEEVQPVSTL